MTMPCTQDVEAASRVRVSRASTVCICKGIYGRKVGARMVTRLAGMVKSRCTYANAVTPGAHKLTNPNPACQVLPGAHSLQTHFTADAGAEPGSCYRVRVR